jgi:hypothetical protein
MQLVQFSEYDWSKMRHDTCPLPLRVYREPVGLRRGKILWIILSVWCPVHAALVRVDDETGDLMPVNDTVEFVEI